MIPRLYIDGPLHLGLPTPLSAEQVHYLKNVLRRGEGDELRLFNGRDGEFAATIVEIKKKMGAAHVGEQTREQEAEPDLRQGGWVYTLVTSNGRAHLLDKQATWRNGRWGPVWVPSVNSPPPPSRLTSRTSLLDAMRPGSAASLSEASAGAGRGSGAASPSPSLSGLQLSVVV